MIAMTEEEAVHRVIAALRKREHDADWNVNDILRPANLLMVIKVFLALAEEHRP